MLLSILIVVATLVLVAMSEHVLYGGLDRNEDGKRPLLLSCVGPDSWCIAITIALITGLSMFFDSIIGGWSILCWLAMLGVLIYMVRRWSHHGSEFWEMIWFILALFPVGWAFMNASAEVQKTLLANTGKFWPTAFHTLSVEAIVIAAGLAILVFLQRRTGSAAEDDERDDEFVFFYRFTWGAFIALIIACIVILITVPKWSALKTTTEPVKESIVSVQPTESKSETEPAKTEPTETQPPAETEAKYIHDIVLMDDDLDNDFNFGPDALLAAIDKKKIAKEDVEGKPRKELAKLVTADELVEELLESIHDPANLAAFLASCDVRFHTTLLDGEAMFTLDSEKNMDRTNAAARLWSEDQEAFEAAYRRACKWISRTYSQEVVSVKAVTNQMYEYSLEVGELPTVVFYETNDEEVVALVLKWSIKGELKSLELNTICDFQLLNGAEDFGVTPKPKPVNPKTPEPDPDPTPAPTEPKPTEPKPKDPAEDPVNQGNAPTGGGNNKPSDGAGEVQPEDPRTTETPTGSDDDNHHGYSDPGTVTPTTPTAPPEHQGEDDDPVDQNPMTYETDPPTDYGPVDPSEEPTPSEGDGDFTPPDCSVNPVIFTTQAPDEGLIVLATQELSEHSSPMTYEVDSPVGLNEEPIESEEYNGEFAPPD
jgi:hypothetical protein